MKKYMVIERFKPECYEKVYKRFDEKGRMLPEGLFYLNSWVNKEQNLCFQLMESNDEDLFRIWIDKWRDLTDFEIVPID
ncbi:MAG: DUF3303 domain-containing protein [Balneolales bacterium]|nr:DUF3303 domain-containing protein [Balneolales bacterium]